MNFTTPTFLFYFLPLVLVVYFILPKFRNVTLVLASSLFYFWGEGRYLFSIYLWVLSNFITSKAIYYFSIRYGLKKDLPKFCLFLSVIANLSILIYFKYSSFIISNSSLLGIHLRNIEVYLPLAISFFTFHAISYNIDIFRGIIKPESSFSRLVLYFTFFPHLIAGPIVRYNQIQQQLYRRTVKVDLIAEGIHRFIIGLLKKIVIANTLASASDQIFAVGPHHLSIEQAWLGVICFSLQIFYDFSGYTDMAIGLGKIFGFTFPENFNYPYISSSIQEFWRRWHITLSNWIRDYIYIPLGGSRKGEFRTYLNLLVTFSLAGLWHGANWNFLIWGIYHSIFLILERVKGGILVNWIPTSLKHLYTILTLLISWLLFRSVDLSQFTDFIKIMFNMTSNNFIYFTTKHYLENDVIFALIIGIIFATPFPQKITIYLRDFISKKVFLGGSNVLLVNTIYLITFILISIISLIYITGPTFQSFIYFRF